MDYPQEHSNESKRKSRNLSEKKRRDAFNSLVTELAALVSGIERRLDKSNVLKQTIAFLKRHNQLRTEYPDNREIDHARPNFVTAEEYFRVLLDSLEAFVFAVELSEDGNALICFVSENTSDLLTDQLRGKSLYALLDRENEILVREAFRTKLAERNGKQLEMASTTDFIRFTLTLNVQEPSALDQERRALELSITGQCKVFDGASSSPACICLAKPRHSHGPSPISSLPTVGQIIGSTEFTTRMDVEFRFIRADSCVAHLLGYEPIELLGTSFYDYCHPNDLEKLAESHEKLKTQTDVVSPAYRFRTKSQRYVWIRTKFYMTYHEWNSKPEFIVGSSCILLGNTQTPDDSKNGKDPIGRSGWRALDNEKEAATIVVASSEPSSKDRQIFRPQPGVSIEHAPISMTTPISKSITMAKRPRMESVVQENSQDDGPIPVSLSQMNERSLWELLEKRQSNLQEKIVEHQHELKRLQEQLLTAVPLLASSSSPVSSVSGTNETLDLNSPASSSLSPASGGLITNCQSQPNQWTQQQSGHHPSHFWTAQTPKYFENPERNPFPM